MLLQLRNKANRFHLRHEVCIQIFDGRFFGLHARFDLFWTVKFHCSRHNHTINLYVCKLLMIRVYYFGILLTAVFAKVHHQRPSCRSSAHYDYPLVGDFSVCGSRISSHVSISSLCFVSSLCFARYCRWVAAVFNCSTIATAISSPRCAIVFANHFKIFG